MTPQSATSAKRPRTPSSSSSLTTSTGSTDPPHKASRVVLSSSSSYDTSTASTSSGSTVKQGGSVATASTHPLLCNLPPTCHRQPTPIANTNELERHYATYHAHVCEEKSCGCVFPDARLLELHQTECHDPLAALRKERGEKIFQCHLPAPTCGRNFLTPKARRLHLIQAHSFPKEYFFAVTNKGIGGLLKKWGEGASMVRKEWKPREGKPPGNGDVDMRKYRDEEDDEMGEENEVDKEDEHEDEMDEEDEVDEDEEEPADLEATPRMLPRTTGIHSPGSSISSSNSNNHHHHYHHRTNNANANTTSIANDNSGIAGLTNSLDSLSLVPNSIRFGRGGKSGGFLPNGRGGRGRGRARGGATYPAGRGGSVPGGVVRPEMRPMDFDGARMGSNGRGGGRAGAGVPVGADPLPYDGVPRGRGRGRARGRGRGRGF